MLKIEADTLEKAYEDAAAALQCSVIELETEVLQHPKGGVMGMFKKTAIIVATKKGEKKENEPIVKPVTKEVPKKIEVIKDESIEEKELITNKVKSKIQNIFSGKINPLSKKDEKISQKEELKVETVKNVKKKEKFIQPKRSATLTIDEIVKSVKKEINHLFDLTCFQINTIDVKAYDNETLLIEFRGEDAALLIGKEGYRYKAISYMLFNWINSKYKVQLRLEIAEFLKNQEESVARYIESICEIIDKDGRAQTKVLDGVLVQIALKELRDKYPHKYVVIRTTKDGLKYIIVNDYHTT